nr:OST-HTH/LOTUS domain-containing protein [Alcaligenes faecalis]
MSGSVFFGPQRCTERNSSHHASFDPRNYGFSKLSDLVRKQQHYVDVKETTDAAGFTHLHIKLK